MTRNGKWPEIHNEWKEEYEKEFLAKIEKFIIKNGMKTTGHFNIVPNDIEQHISTDLMCYADFVKPTCKVELMTVTSERRPRPFMKHPFVPQTNLKNLRIKYYIHDDKQVHLTD